MNDRASRRTKVTFHVAGVFIATVALLLLATLLYKQKEFVRKEVQKRTASIEAGPWVTVVSATRSSAMQSVSFLGEARAYAEATLYSKVSGYLSVLNVDKGDKVVLDQVVAVIQSPELDRQYRCGRG